ncbi:MAG: type 1 glutamine amidotransferase [bacterium]|nr:type 1 glutamine amidotransferase [bacterium]
MGKILICQHAAYEILGTFLPLLKEKGVRIRHVNFERTPEAEPGLAGCQGLVLLGGPQHLYENNLTPHLAYEIKLIREAIEQEMPVLGICLGAQLIAKALGGVVKRNSLPEIGWTEIEPTEEGKKDPLLRHFSKKQILFEWHEDTFELPEGAIHLAQSKYCPNQAFRYGKNVYGFQFHLERDEAFIEGCLENQERHREFEKIPGLTVEKMRASTRKNMPAQKELSRKVFEEFIEILGNNKKRLKRLPSR